MPLHQFIRKTAVESCHYTVPHHPLEFDMRLSVLETGQEPSQDGNLIIEGDNLLALKALLPTHAGRVKCVYIDPRYNTDNEGWIYNDNLTQRQFKEWIGQTVAIGSEQSEALIHQPAGGAKISHAVIPAAGRVASILDEARSDANLLPEALKLFERHSADSE